MLRRLSVRNYVLIDSLDTEFPEDLVIITGQTGAGKSILLGALSLLLGAKADASMIGGSSDNCVVEGEFQVPDDDAMKEMLEEQTKVVSQYNSPETMEQLRKATEAIQADYLKEVDYDRIQTAQKIVGKDIPTLILQGERDYQVTMEDFGIWKEAFSTACGTDGSDVTGKECVIDSDIIMKSYPGLNHTIP